MSQKTGDSQAAKAVDSQKGIEHRKSEDFFQVYANNTLFQSSNWDLKILFGELEPSLGPNVILQHTAVTLPWAQVKIIIYFLSIHLALHEAQFGRVQIGKGLINEIAPQRPKDVIEAGEVKEESWQQMRKLYLDFIAANPEAVTKK